MVITDQGDFSHVSGQVDNKELKLVEKLKILSVTIDHKKESLHHSSYIPKNVWIRVQWVFYIEQKKFLPQFGLHHLHNGYYLPYLNYCTRACEAHSKNNSIGNGKILKNIA